MYDISAETYSTAKQFHYVKVIIDGVYISGIKVCASMKNEGTLWIQMPSYKVGVKKYKRYIEVANESNLGKEIYRVIEELMTPIIFPDTPLHGGNVSEKSQLDTVITDFDANEPINLDDIPF